jgi:hypothetical protein
MAQRSPAKKSLEVHRATLSQGVLSSEATSLADDAMTIPDYVAVGVLFVSVTVLGSTWWLAHQKR